MLYRLCLNYFFLSISPENRAKKVCAPRRVVSDGKKSNLKFKFNRWVNITNHKTSTYVMRLFILAIQLKKEVSND